MYVVKDILQDLNDIRLSLCLSSRYLFMKKHYMSSL